MKGTWREGSLAGDLEGCVEKALFGKPGGGSFAMTFEREEKYIWAPFFDLEVIRILSLGAIWNFSKGTGLHGVDVRLWCKKGLSK